ncbi:MAG: hypothetical protein AB8I58_07365 [Anaerolineales bacterium]
MKQVSLYILILGSIIIAFLLAACTTSETIPSTIPATDNTALTASTSTPDPTATLPTTATPIPPTPQTLKPTPTPVPPKKVLFVGNSLIFWNDGIDYHMAQLAGSANPPLAIEAESSTKMMMPLQRLWQFAKDEIENGDYDIVILQEDMQTSSSYKESKTADSFHEYARKFDALIKESGAKTVFFMAWPFEEGGEVPITYEEIAQAHRDIATELGADVAPVALAIQRTIKERPDLDVNDADGFHPSIYATYLSANVVYATISGKSPEGLTYLPPKGNYKLSDRETVVEGITEEEAAFLQRVAWETVQDYQAQQ